MKIFGLIVLSLFLCVSSFAQDKIGVVDSNTFFSKEKGITELVVANKKLEDEFKIPNEELKTLNEKSLKIVIEIGNGHNYRGAKMTDSEVRKRIDELASEAQNLSKRMNLILDEINPRIESRNKELIEPIIKRIDEKLEIFKYKKGYKVIIDKSLIEKRMVFVSRKTFDITNEFIKFCNEEFEKEASERRASSRH
jgi:Skp family chaperone for outer membrane proteins